MNFDPLFKRKIIAFLIMIVSVAMASFYTLRAEVMNGLSDSLGNNQFATKRVLKDSELSEPTRFILRPEHNEAQYIRVSGLKPGLPTSLGTPVRFTLTNLGDSNDYPNIQIFLVNALGKIVRDVKLTSADYKHEDKFESAEVEILVDLKPGETGFTVKPYYEGDQS